MIVFVQVLLAVVVRRSQPLFVLVAWCCCLFACFGLCLLCVVVFWLLFDVTCCYPQKGFVFLCALLLWCVVCLLVIGCGLFVV